MRVEHGTAGHFIGARSCCFRRHTSVSGYRVSTVGCYHHVGSDEPREVGPGRMYETMVFVLGDDGDPSSWIEVDLAGYDDANAANAGHE